MMARSRDRSAGPTPWGRPVRLVLATILVVVGLSMTMLGSVFAQDEDGRVYIVAISGEIDLGLAPYLDRVLRDAEEGGAAAVLIEIDTPGGRLDAVLEMRDSLLDSDLRTIAYVDRTAFSAGALIALASEEIHFAPGAVMGAATPVDAGTGVPADEKVISAVRTTFRATAVERDRDPAVAEAMVDPDVEVEGVSPAGSLLTLGVTEAVEVGYADSVSVDRAALLEEVGLGDRDLVETAPTLAENVVRFITNPILASLLLTLGIWLILGDLLSGGIGLAAAAGVVALATFFYGHLLAGLAGWEDVALVGLGVVLILVELLVIPGFGVPGILGLAAVLGGSFLAMVNRDFDFVSGDQFLQTGLVIGFSFIAITGGLIGMLAYLSRRGGPPGLVLRTQPGESVPVTERGNGGWMRWFGSDVVLDSQRDVSDEPPEEEPEPQPAGPTGIALSDLRPAGVAEIRGRRVDVVTEGEYIEAGASIEVIHDEGYRRVVRRVRS